MRGIIAPTSLDRDATSSGGKWFRTLAVWTSYYSGRPATFSAALAIVIIWAVTGPLFRFSDTWQLVINTGTTIVTFLMVFLIQATQNRDTTAIQLKLDELILASKARNRMVAVEELTDGELDALKAQVKKQSARSLEQA